MADAAPPPMPVPEDVAALRQRVAQLEAALTAQQHGEQARRDAKDAAEQIVETVREPLLVLTPDFRVQSANPAFYQLFQVRPAETIGLLIYQLGNGQWDIPEFHTLLEGFPVVFAQKCTLSRPVCWTPGTPSVILCP